MPLLPFQTTTSCSPFEKKARSFMRHLQAMVADPSDPSDHCRNRNRDPSLGWRLALMDRSNFAAKLCPHRNIGAVLSNGLGLPNRYIKKSPKEGRIQNMEPTHPHSQRPSEKVSGSGWGGIPQRSQRAKRCIERGEKGFTSEPFSTTALVN
ncbi:MAG: hypothetical protein ACOX52_06425 [Verrucomicrobiota bacterium]